MLQLLRQISKAFTDSVTKEHASFSARFQTTGTMFRSTISSSGFSRISAMTFFASALSESAQGTSYSEDTTSTLADLNNILGSSSFTADSPDAEVKSLNFASSYVKHFRGTCSLVTVFCNTPIFSANDLFLPIAPKTNFISSKLSDRTVICNQSSSPRNNDHSLRNCGLNAPRS